MRDAPIAMAGRQGSVYALRQSAVMHILRICLHHDASGCQDAVLTPMPHQSAAWRARKSHGRKPCPALSARAERARSEVNASIMTLAAWYLRCQLLHIVRIRGGKYVRQNDVQRTNDCFRAARRLAAAAAWSALRLPGGGGGRWT